jgi:3-oxoacyl-[acyl-carrier protein] reductase
MNHTGNHHKSLTGKTAIVTGAGRGAGAAMAHALAEAGARVCVSDLNPDRAKRVADEITAAGGEAFPFQADVSNKFQVASMIETTRDHYQTLDIFAHHAHISPSEPFLKMDEWEWRRTLDVNLSGAFFCLQLASRVMVDEGGGIIAIPLYDLEQLGEGQAAFAATQIGVIGLVGVLEMELEGTAVHIETIPLVEPADTARHLMALCIPE